MPIDFPSNPLVGQTYSYGGVNYVYTMQGVWSAAGAGAPMPVGFRAHKNGVSQGGITASTWTKLTFGFEDYDTGGYYDTTNSKWTPPAGIVHIDAGTFVSVMQASNFASLGVYKNGVLYRYATIASSFTNDGIVIAIDDYANGTDYYELWINILGVTGAVLGEARAYFSGHVISPAGPKGDIGPMGISIPGSTTGFSANKNNITQTGLTQSGWTKVTFTNEYYDIGGYYDAANSRWTPPVGIVHLDLGIVLVNGTVAIGLSIAGIYKNGVLLEQNPTYVYSGGQGFSQISLDNFANGTDYYEAYVWIPSGAAGQVSGVLDQTYFNGHVTGVKGDKGDQGIPGATGGTAQDFGFRANKGGSFQTGIPNVTDTKLTFTTEELDRGGYYDAPNSRWTPPAGFVQLSCLVTFQNSSGGITHYLGIAKNGVVQKYHWIQCGTGEGGFGGVTCVYDDYASGTDYYEAYYFVSGMAGTSVYGDTKYSWFQGHMVGGRGPQGVPGPVGGITNPPSMTPGGRLTLQSATPVMTTSQPSKNTLYYTPYNSDGIPLFDGSNFSLAHFVEIFALTNDTTRSPTVIGNTKVNDWFVWQDAGGILQLSHGPDWTDTITRSAGTALVRVKGIWLNNVNITNGPLAQRGTYVGTTYSSSDSLLHWIYGSIASTGGPSWLGVWNAYNRVSVATMVGDTTTTWSYSGGVIRTPNGSTNMRVTAVFGLQEDAVGSSYNCPCTTTSGYNSSVGVGYDSTTAYATGSSFSTEQGFANWFQAIGRFDNVPGPGGHTWYALENGSSSSFAGQNGPWYWQNGLWFNARM